MDVRSRLLDQLVVKPGQAAGIATRRRIAKSIGLIALCLVVSLATGSRAGWLAMGIGILVTGAAWLAFACGRDQSDHHADAGRIRF